MVKKIIILLMLSYSLTGCWETAKGEKIGTLVKLSDEGFFIKTHEGELIRGGMSDGSGSFGKSFHFTIENQDAFNTAQDAMNNNKQVHIYYHKEWVTLWRCESDNIFVDKIEVVN